MLVLFLSELFYIKFYEILAILAIITFTSC